ncbi:phosphatidylserine decarboxylase family protein [Elizabethkingia anophelis]|uniref:phosphatidylserine decarboxylase family protein n=1 Tax=Elizabethkingia anophelis TaxID=1117645 RepID=UPI0020114814|nr:phosphatidylserine decarboxylase family protein [Elizabethkingia anophelis]MCL1688421.1 phosphatidylserine decarboxylase family protein [Elizabethkingia anophelis]MDV3576002.1 phosphatidylserine decarboxylase family protein [Elizabethkingia anophelis]MDV3601109.1 phosphatidylserine decarboxylase family protein [Elizabethkingia anophelis]MDV3608123.1 phosphatidylserine decarboxylase family protein [Elizabethkingia anophelis]MDV3640486.1 phosphatidylserine decarboxylase family protein [Elizab
MKFHKEGKGTLLTVLLAIIIISGVSIYFLKMWSLLIIIPLLVLYGFVMWFFRNPERNILDQVENVIAPVDGKVVMIKKVFEGEVLQQECLQISIFMSPLNVHVCRYPVTGEVTYKKYHKGKYLVAWHEKSSELNERTTMAVKTLTGTNVVFRQIAGYVARRIVFYPEVGDSAKAGYEYGFIKFGSRMDVFLPLDTEVICKIGDITKGGIDVIAKLPAESK